MKKQLFCGLFICLLAGCSAFAPTVDARREAGLKDPLGLSRPNAPVICYGFGSREKVDALAQAECDKVQKQAVFQKETAFSCTLLTPTHVFYTCE